MKYSLGLDMQEIVIDKALTGSDALDFVKQDVENHLGLECGYTLILMDCNMPFMDGYECSVRIREYLLEKEVEQPLIAAVTGHTEQAYIDRCIHSGMNQVLSKPVDAKVLGQMAGFLGLPRKE